MIVVTAPLATACAEVAPDNASLLLHDGFDQGGFAAGGGLFYKENFERRAGRVVFGAASSFRGTGALTLTAMASCPPTGSTAASAPRSGSARRCLPPYRSTVWYGLALRLDDPLPQDDRRYVIAQWKREIRPAAEGDYTPFPDAAALSGGISASRLRRIASSPIRSGAWNARMAAAPARRWYSTVQRFTRRGLWSPLKPAQRARIIRAISTPVRRTSRSRDTRTCRRRKRAGSISSSNRSQAPMAADTARSWPTAS
ncbi:hypothetical protein FQV39_24280 [Bosea sp. F3-2]|nr:hypothetical protein FQV39_24280 [Bosea sp. F3-2]